MKAADLRHVLNEPLDVGEESLVPLAETVPNGRMHEFADLLVPAVESIRVVHPREAGLCLRQDSLVPLRLLIRPRLLAQHLVLFIRGEGPIRPNVRMGVSPIFCSHRRL